jgi:hypothetical protein
MTDSAHPLFTQPIIDIIQTKYDHLSSDEIQRIKQTLPADLFKHYYAHIKINLGRCAGHSTAIKHFVEEDERNIIIVPTSSEVIFWQRSCKALPDRKIYNLQIIADHPAWFGSTINGTHIPICFIDRCLNLTPRDNLALNKIIPIILSHVDLLVELQ